MRVWLFFLFIFSCFFFAFAFGCFAPPTFIQSKCCANNEVEHDEMTRRKIYLMIRRIFQKLWLDYIIAYLHLKKKLWKKNWNGVLNAHKKMEYTIWAHVYMATPNKHSNMHTHTLDCEPLRTAPKERERDWQMAYEWQMFLGMNFGFFVSPLDNSNLNVFILSLYRRYLKKSRRKASGNCKIIKYYWSRLVCIDSCVPSFFDVINSKSTFAHAC